MSEDLVHLQERIDRNAVQIHQLLHSQKAHWTKVQEKFHAVYLLLNKNTETDRRTHEAIKALREAIESLKNEEIVKLKLIEQSNKSQSERTRGIEASTRRQANRVSKTNSVIFLGILLLFFLYLKEDIAAGKVFDAIITLLSASGMAAYGIHTVGGKNSDND